MEKIEFKKAQVQPISMVVDIVKSTELLKDADITALEKFNVFFIQYFYKALAEYGLVSLTPKFTGDGWIVTVEETIKAFNLIGVGKELILSLNRELKASGINFNGQVRFRIGLSCAADIRIQFGNITEYVGDSIRRATRVASVCRENEIWIDETLHTHLNRYFYLGPICINDIRKSNPKLDNDIELLKSVERCKLTNPDEQTEYLARIIRLEGVEPEAVTAVIEKAKRVQSQEEARSVEVAAIILGSAGHESATAIHRQLDHKGFGRDLSQWNLALYLATSFSAAKEIFEELKKKIVPDVKSYSTLVNKGDFEQGKALLAEMIAREIRPNEVTYSTLINKGDFEQGKALLAEMIEREIRPNEVTYSTLINKGDFEQGKELLAEMIAREIRPNEVTYSTLINKGDFEQGKELLAEMIAREIRPNEVTYSTLINKGDFEQGKALLAEMIEREIRPNEVTYSTLINKGDFEQGKELLAEMIAREIRPNEVTYSTLINKGDFEQGKALLAEMIARGFRPNEMTYSTLLTKDIGISRIEDVMKWLGDQPGFRPHYIEPQIKRLQNNLRMEEAYYLILCWPHLGASKKLLATNVELAKAAFNKIKGKDPDSFGNNFNYAIGIGYFLQNNGKKATYHLRKALEEAKAEPRKKHIEEMLKHIENNA